MYQNLFYCSIKGINCMVKYYTEVIELKNYIYLVSGVLLIISSSITYMFEKWLAIYHWSVIINKFNPFPSNPDNPSYIVAILLLILGVTSTLYHFKQNKN